MTVTKQGKRAITVDGVRLLWWFRLSACGVADCPQDWSHVAIVGASREGSVVVCHVPSGSGPATPARIAAAARTALAEGWRPGEGAGERHMHLPGGGGAARS